MHCSGAVGSNETKMSEKHGAYPISGHVTSFDGVPLTTEFHKHTRFTNDINRNINNIHPIILPTMKKFLMICDVSYSEV